MILYFCVGLLIINTAMVLRYIKNHGRKKLADILIRIGARLYQEAKAPVERSEVPATPVDEKNVLVLPNKNPFIHGGVKYDASLIKAVYEDRKSMTPAQVAEKYSITTSAVSYITYKAKSLLGNKFLLARESRTFTKYSPALHLGILADRHAGMRAREIAKKYKIPVGSLAKIFRRARELKNETSGTQPVPVKKPEVVDRAIRPSNKDRYLAIYRDVHSLGVQETALKYGLKRHSVYVAASSARDILGIGYGETNKRVYSAYPDGRKRHSDEKAFKVLADIERGLSFVGAGHKHAIPKGTVSWLINRAKNIRRNLEGNP